MNSLLSAVVAVSASILMGCAATPNATQQRAELIQRDQAWSSLASQGKDIERIVGFWSDDATVYPTGAPVIRGKAAIREYVRQSLAVPGFQIRWRPDQAEISSDSTLAYTMGENFVTVPGPDGKPMTIAGRYTTIWRREAGGEWKCVVDIWNSGS